MEIVDLEEFSLFVSIWSWQILAMLFFCTSLIQFALPRTGITSVFTITFFLLFMGSEYFSLKKRKELTENGKED